MRSLMALTAAAAIIAGATPAAAGPASVTMVNAAGRTITIPAPAAAGLRSAAAGSAGSAPSATAGPLKAGPPAPDGGGRAVIGADDRQPETAPGAFPWRAIVHLTTNQGRCTGFLVSRDVVVTAGHCVYDNGWVTSYTAAPGKVGATDPNGSCSGGIDDVWTTSTYYQTGSAASDYGLIKLTCDIGATVGWFGWWYAGGENLVGATMYVEGYPGDKQYGTMWWDSDPITSQSTTNLYYSIDTESGQSGSPIYHYNSTTPGLCAGWCITGIHTATGSGRNLGTRFNATVMSFINYWVAQP